jgi:hypothetical protein
MFQIIFKNFPYTTDTEKRSGVHVWTRDSDTPLLWGHVAQYIKTNTKVPLHYLEIRDPVNGLSSRIILNSDNKTPVVIDNFKSTYNSNSCSEYCDVWFDIYMNVFGKVKNERR